MDKCEFCGEFPSTEDERKLWPASYVKEVGRESLLAQIPSLPQRQDGCLEDQLDDLLKVATKLGMYDAADIIRDAVKMSS